eukprot:jgi/Bigna1/137792/aug1.41_g12500
MMFCERQKSMRNGMCGGQQLHVFSKFEDQTKCAGHLPTSKCLTKACKRDHELRLEWLDHQLSQARGSVLKIDHSFKVPKRMRDRGMQLFESCFTVLNEYDQVVAMNLCHTKSLHELRAVLTRLKRRCEACGEEGPNCVFTDDVSDAQFSENTLGSF